MKAILYITEESPFPAFGGGRIRRYGILRALSVSGYKVHAIVDNKFKINLDHFKIENVFFYEFNFNPGKLSRIFKYFKIFTKNKRLMRLIRKVMASNNIDLAFLDCYFIGQYISFFKKLEIPVVLGTENSQSSLNRMRPASNLLRKVEKYTNYLLQYVHERLFFNRADAVIVVSNNDFQFHKAFVNEKKLYIIPNFLDFSRYSSRGEKDNYIIITGSFRAYQNIMGLTWFLNEVWDDELNNLTRFIIAGYYSRELLEEIKRKKKNLKNVYALGQLDDITPYISQARIAVVPLLQGSGSRFKILEAMALKTLVLSTSKGAEGIEHANSIIIMDQAADFKNEILKILKGSDISNYKTKIERAYQIALNQYSFPVNQKRIAEILNKTLFQEEKKEEVEKMSNRMLKVKKQETN